jgi:hypothetical protein
MESRLLLDVVVAQGAAILQLLSGEDETLLVGRNSFLVLDFGLDVVDCVGRLHLEGDGLTREGLNEARRWLTFLKRESRKQLRRTSAWLRFFVGDYRWGKKVKCGSLLRMEFRRPLCLAKTTKPN